MFTGLIEAVGTVETVEPTNEGRRLTITAPLGEALPLGASIAVDGVCLTAVSSERDRFSAVAAAETLACTTLGQLAQGARVNLERPLRLGDRLGGHLVAGHVDGVGQVAAHGRRGDALDITVAAAPDLLRYVIEKGSVAVDGISLTVNRVDGSGFDVSLIPHTQTATTFAQKPVGASVNLEVDLMGKYVEKLLSPRAEDSARRTGVTLAKLKEHGFAD